MSLKTNFRRPVPQWLSHLDVSKLRSAELPLRELLKDSLYYPACGFDGRPIQFLGGFIHSFVYVDYGVRKDEVIWEVMHNGLRGYDLAGVKELTLSEISHKDWDPQPPIQYAHQINRYDSILECRKEHFALWMIFSRENSYGDDHGPSRLSMLYICADGIATYQNLYCHHQLAPEVLTIVNPGTGFGGNWTDFCSQSGFFAWTVLNNCKRLPRYMLAGGLLFGYKESFWPQIYSIHVEWLQYMNGNGVWMIDPEFRKFTNGNGRCD